MELKSKANGKQLVQPIQEYPEWLLKCGNPVKQPATLQGLLKYKKGPKTEDHSERKKVCTKRRRTSNNTQENKNDNDLQQESYIHTTTQTQQYEIQQSSVISIPPPLIQNSDVLDTSDSDLSSIQSSPSSFDEEFYLDPNYFTSLLFNDCNNFVFFADQNNN